MHVADIKTDLLTLTIFGVECVHDGPGSVFPFHVSCGPNPFNIPTSDSAILDDLFGDSSASSTDFPPNDAGLCGAPYHTRVGPQLTDIIFQEAGVELVVVVPVVYQLYAAVEAKVMLNVSTSCGSPDQVFSIALVRPAIAWLANALHSLQAAAGPRRL